MAPAIPDRWTQYKPVGEQIQGTRFIAFKVPLSSNANEKVKLPIRLDADMLLKTIPALGLIIDLTNTNRYYDPQYFISKGIEYRKLKIPGHVTPPEHLVKMFKQHVREYLHENEHNDKLVGVHCTHGVNRTGFFICNYMITEMTMNPDEAIQKFSKARGHSIERQNYLAALLGVGQKNPVANTVTQRKDLESKTPKRRTSISNDRVEFEQRWNAKRTHKQRTEKDYPDRVQSRKQFSSDNNERKAIEQESVNNWRDRSNRESFTHSQSNFKFPKYNDYGDHTTFQHKGSVNNWRDRSNRESFTHRNSIMNAKLERTGPQKTGYRNFNTTHKNAFRHQSSNSKYNWRRTHGNDTSERIERDSRR